MARRPIDIGAIGNDGTGDSIRDAFRKVNDNFRELYSSLGLGERLLFIEMDDTPSTYIGQENAILAVNQTTDGISFKQIVGGVGVIIDQTNPSEIRLATEFSEISADDSPQLGGNLSARSGGNQYRILDLPPYDFVSQTGGPISGDEAPGKDYVDSKLSRHGVNAVNPATGLVTQAFGTMSGPLILSRDPEPEDDLLYDGKIAATKNYVDNAGFSSVVNLYVATSGEDDRLGVSISSQGRSLATAYRTIEAALKRAEEVELASPIDLGPYQKTLTFNGGQFKCTLADIITSPDSGTGFSGRVFMSVDTVEFYIDPVTLNQIRGTNYRPGDILTIDGGIGVSARLEVLSTSTTPGPISTFRILSQGVYEALPGNSEITASSTSEFGAGAKFNLTYKVNSITIDNKGGSISNPSFSDYGLVSVRISGGGGSGAFGTANVVNGQIDSITVTDTGKGFTSLPTLIVNLPRFLIFTNGIRTDFTGDVLTQTSEAFRSRDIREGLLIKGENSGALAIILAHSGALDSDGNEIFDMDVISGNFQLGETLRYGDSSKNIQITVLIESGIYEENLPLKIPQNVAIVGNEFRRVIVRPKSGMSSSPWAFGKFRRDKLIDGLTITDRLYGYHYLQNTAGPVYPKINNAGSFDSAAAILKINRIFIQEEVIAWINEQIKSNTLPFNLNFQYNESLCKRDVGLIVDAIIFDLKYGGYNRTISAGLKYKGSASGLIAITTQLSETIAGIRKIESLAQDIIRNQQTPIVYNILINQIVDESFSAERGSGAQSKNISSASRTNPVRIVTTEDHFYRDRERISISDVSGMINLNNNNYFVKNINDTTLDLYQDFDLTIPVNGLGFGTYVSGGFITPQGGVIGELISGLINVIGTSGLINEPLDNEELDMFLCNDANIIRAVTGQGQGGFMMVLDPEGQILAKSPYCQEAASFSRSINSQTFSGGMFVDGFTGNIQFTHESSASPFNIKVSGLDRKPLTPFSFIVNDTVHRVNYFRNFSYSPFGSSADFVLDETTPFTLLPGKQTVTVVPGNPGIFTRNEHKLQVGATLKFYSTGTLPSPLVEDREYYVKSTAFSSNNFTIGLELEDFDSIELLSTGTGTISYQRIYEILTPGNRSMLSNDYTQVNDLGYGLVAANGGLTEAVSMFTYYCHISYYSLNGGQIRSIAGSSAHGNFALVAEGADPLEVPTPVTIFDDFSQRVICYAPTPSFEQNVGDLFIFVYKYRTLPLPGGELEIDHGQQIFRYPVASAETTGLPEGVARLNLVSEGGGNATGLFAIVPDGTRMTFRNSGAIVLTGDIVEVATRPSTGLVLKETSDVYRILQFSRYTDINAPYEVEFTQASPTDIEVIATIIEIDTNVCTTIGNHLLDVGDKFIPKITSNGLTSGTIYYIVEVPDYNQFVLSTSLGGSPESLTNGTNLVLRGSKTHKVFEDQLIEFLLFEALVEASISGTTLTVNVLNGGKILPGMIISGSGVSIGTRIESFDTGTGAAGTYNININQSVSLTTMTAVAIPPTGILSGQRYFVVEDGLTDTVFRISNTRNGSPVNVTAPGTGLIGYADVGLALTNTRENYNFIDLTINQPGEFATGPFTCTISIGSPAIITHVGHGLTAGDVIAFRTTGTLPTGISNSRNFFVLTTPTPDTFTVAASPLFLTPADTSGTQSGTQSYGQIAGLAGTSTIAIVAVAPQERIRLPGSIFYFKGDRYVITNYEDEGSTGQPFGRITFNRPLLQDMVKFTSPYTIKAAVPKRSVGAQGSLTIRISLTRVTGHDLLDIGTGGYADTNYPNEIYGPPVNTINASQETEERDVGRVFYVTTDQFGNFRVGPFFEVDQGTGRVTFSAAIALSNLDGIGFKRGVPIAEFSVDATMADNAIDTVPTENAVRGYIERRLGTSHTGGVIPLGQLIPPLSGGFLSLDGQLPMKNQLSMGNNKIGLLADPTLPQDAVNLRSLIFGNFQNIQFNDLRSADIMVFTGDGDNAVNAKVVGDVTFELRPGIDSTLNQVDVQIVSDSIINSDINSSAAIAQSKLSMNAATVRVDAAGILQANLGLSSFDSAQFDSIDGWISIKNNGIILSKLSQIGSKTVVGNAGLSAGNPDVVSFTTVVNDGGAIKKSQYPTTGFLRRIGGTGTLDSDFSIVEMAAIYTGTGDNGKLVVRSDTGDFAGRIIAADQINVTVQESPPVRISKKSISAEKTSTGGYIQYFGYLAQGGVLVQDGDQPSDRKTAYWNNRHEFKTIDGQLDAPISCSLIETKTLTTGGNSQGGTITGRWTLSGTSPDESRLQATYSADLAEYYEGDYDYEVGTVLIFGGDKEVTISNSESDTRVAGVVSNTAAFVMYDACPGKKNLVALQGRVPCKVVGKINKGDLLVTSSKSGVATSCKNPSVGTIVGKAIENYDSDHIGIIEIAVGRT